MMVLVSAPRLGSRRLRAAFFRAALLTLSCAIHAAAMPDAELGASETRRARQHYARAIELYDAGAQREALREFRRAYAITSDARLLFNIGQLELELQEHALARRSLEQYLREAKGSITDERREDVLRQLEALAEHDAGGVVPAVEAGARGARATEAIEVSKQGTSPERASRDGAASPFATAAWISSGVLGLGAMSGAVATLLASRRHAELRSMRSSPEEASSAREKLDRQRERVQRLALATDVLAVAALGTAGLGLYFTLSAGSSDASSVSVELGAGNLRVMGSF
jgi:tetratricopeptide (TPR) repeat protein